MKFADLNLPRPRRRPRPGFTFGESKQASHKRKDGAAAAAAAAVCRTAVAKQVRELRERRHLTTVNALARRSGLSFPTIAAIEREGNCTIETLARVAVALEANLYVNLEAASEGAPADRLPGASLSEVHRRLAHVLAGFDERELTPVWKELRDLIAETVRRSSSKG